MTINAPTREELPLPFHEVRGRDGAFAEFDPDGRLVRLSCWRDGRPVGHRLEIDRVGERVMLTSEEVLTGADLDPDEVDGPGVAFRLAIDAAIGTVWDDVDEQRRVRCAFCGKQQHEVARLIAGPASYICDECIRLCAEILEEE
jgi:hypothetical protein